MVTEHKNYSTKMNTTANMELNITKASAFLKAQRKELERQQTPEAARTYTTILGDIRNLEREISAPEYENHLTEFQEKKAQAKAQLDTLQKEKEDLLQKIARGRQVLESSQFTDENSIEAYEAHGNAVYADYTHAKNLCEKASRKAAPPLFLALGILLAAGGAALMFSSQSGFRLPSLLLFLAALLSVGGGIYFLARNNGNRKDLDYSKKLLQEILSRHLGDETVSSEAMNAFSQRMAEFKRLSRSVLSSHEPSANLETQLE